MPLGNSIAGGGETVNLGDSCLNFFKSDPYPCAKEVTFDDTAWEEVGVPHCFKDLDTYQNTSQNKTFQATAWYRNTSGSKRSTEGGEDISR
jgi:hypothetical protein